MTFRSVFVRDKGAEMYITAKPFRKETNSMSIQIKPGYTNPLATMKQNKPKSKLSNIHKFGGNSDKEHFVLQLLPPALQAGYLI